MSKQTKDRLPPSNPQPLTSLYNLIQTLTQSQKRDFKKYAHFWGGQENTKYLRLFDIVNQYALSGKDKQDLLQHILKDDGFASRAAVSALAGYLSSKILESVRSTPEISPRTNRLHSLLQDIKFLYNKGLNGECYELIRDAMQLAKDIDKSTYLLELHIWERRVLLSVKGVEQMAKRVGEMLAEEQQLVQQIETFFALNTLNNDLFLSLKQGLPMSDFARAKIGEFLQQDEDKWLKQLGLRSRYWYYNSLYYYYELQHKQQGGHAETGAGSPYLSKALDSLESILRLAENEGKLLVSEEPAFYNALIDNYLNLCIRLGEFERIRSIEESLIQGSNETRILRSVVFHRLTEMVRHNDPRAAVAYITENQLNQRLRENEHNIGASRAQVIRYTCGQAYFMLEDYDNASDWFAQIVKASGSRMNSGVAVVSEIQHIICLFALNAFRNDPARPLHNFWERLRRNHKSDEFIDLLFAALKSAFANKKQESKPQIDALSKKMTHHATLQTQYGLVMAWIEAWYNGTSVMAEIEKYNRK